MSHSAHAALSAYTTPIIRAIKTIIRSHVIVSINPVPDVPGGLDAGLRLAAGPYVEVKTDRSRGYLWIGCRQSVQVIPGNHAGDPVAVSISSVTYQLLAGDGRTRFDEIVAYHWTPNDPTAKRSWPHLHIGSAFIDPAARREPLALHKTHFLTGSITAPGFVRMAIEEFGVQPVVADWQERLVEGGISS